jgi:hypothetical protein
LALSGTKSASQRDHEHVVRHAGHQDVGWILPVLYSASSRRRAAGRTCRSPDLIPNFFSNEENLPNVSAPAYIVTSLALRLGVGRLLQVSFVVGFAVPAPARAPRRRSREPPGDPLDGRVIASSHGIAVSRYDPRSLDR